jgi:hypothetical protein
MHHNSILRFAGNCLSAALLLTVATSGDTFAAKPFLPPGQAKAPLVIDEQGAKAFGGKVIGDPNTSSLSCDHAYVRWQVPKGSKNVSILMWHSASIKTWETPTFAGHEGFANLFLRRGFPVYLFEGSPSGQAGQACLPYSYTPSVGRDQTFVNSYRLGIWIPPAPFQPYPGVQEPVNDPEAMNQFRRANYPEAQTLDNVQLQTDEAVEVLKQSGPTVLFTHSGSGIRGWWTRIKTDNVKGIMAFEPGAFVWPQGEVPPPELRADGALVAADTPLNAVVSQADFSKLTTIPIQIFYGDNIPKVLDPINVGLRLTLDSRRIVVIRAKQFADLINKHGGQAQVVLLPDIGVFGNTHFIMADLNNEQIAAMVSDWLSEHGLDQ